MAISKRFDLARTYDDVNAALRRIGKRAGINAEVVERLMQTFRIQTRNGGRALADSAVMEGRMDTPSFRFAAPVSLKQMAQSSTPQSDQYLKLWAQADELTRQANLAKNMKPGAPVPALGGQSIDDVTRLLADMEKANPGLKDLQKANQAWNKEMIKFRQSGEYSTLTKDQANDLRMTQTNAIGGESTDSAIQSQANAARRAIKERLDNEAIGKYVDETRKV